VSQDSDGKIRMREEGVPSDLLDVRIHHLRFLGEYHGSAAAVITILKTPEVIAFQREHKIGPDWTPSISFSSDAFADRKPSVRGDLNDVTVRQALDYVLLTFRGYWLYENCQSPGGARTVLIAFVENLPDAVFVQNKK
jgi:hypothetical protein